MKPINKRFYETNRELQMIRSYAHVDMLHGLICDLTVAFVKALVAQPCIYCGTADDPRGCDRLDNSIGHLQTNVVACCKMCNKVRNNLFSVEEMRQLGVVVAAIRAARKSS